MIHQQANIVFHQHYVLRFSVVVHLVLQPTSYLLHRATSDFAPERGQVCQQLIHYAEYQLISKHKHSIFDMRGSWIMGATAEEMHLRTLIARVCCSLFPRLALDFCNYFTSEDKTSSEPGMA